MLVDDFEFSLGTERVFEELKKIIVNVDSLLKQSFLCLGCNLNVFNDVWAKTKL